MDDIEIDQQPYTLSTKAKVREQLRLMDGQYLLNRFHFYDHLVRDQQVDTIAKVQLNIFVFDWKRTLGLPCDSHLG